MPRLTDESREARRRAILDAARRCFARKGFSATTIADLCAEAGVSAGGIYTHFENKHALAAAIGGDATGSGDTGSGDTGVSGDPDTLTDRLRGPDGEVDARLDLQLWAESLHDPVLHEMVVGAMDRFRAGLASPRPGRPTPSADETAVIEALALGFEVQRALGRPFGAVGLAEAVDRLFPPASDSEEVER